MVVAISLFSHLVKTCIRKYCFTNNFVSSFFLYPGKILCLSVHFSPFFFSVFISQLLEGGVRLYKTKRLTGKVNRLLFWSPS